MSAPATLLYPDADEFPVAPAAERALAARGLALRKVEGHEPDELLAAAPGCSGMLLLRARADGALLDAMPQCRILARIGAGYDLIDVDAARERGVWVTNVPDFCTEELSDSVLMHVLAFSRRLPALVAAARDHRWLRVDEIPTPRRLRGRTLSVLGFGRSGQRTAEKARAFGLDVLAWSRTPRPEALARTGAREATFEQALAADFVSLQLPLTPATRHLIDAAALARMSPDGVLINIARGPVLDTGALVAALSAGRIGGAALDVVDPAPLPPGHPLWELPNVLVTSHSAALSREALDESFATAIDDVAAVLAGRPPLHPVAELAAAPFPRSLETR